MKIKTLAMIVVSALSLSSTAALADTTTVNGGTVHFKGEVVNAACAVAPLYFAFRIMVACGVLMLLIIGASFWSVIRNRIGEKKWLLRAAFYGLPLPWIAVESGWFVAEYGRQPWAIGEVLPTAVANSSLTAGDLIFSMVLICGLYTLFLVAELFLMFKFARKGPSSLKTGRYHFEQSSAAIQSAR